MLTVPIDAADLVSVPVLDEELLVTTYPNHPLAMKRKITPADLNKQPFILFETGSITRRLVDEFFTRERIEVEIVMETENVEIIKAMVRSGLGISIVPWQAVAGRRESEAVVRQPDRRALAGTAVRVAVSEDDPAPAVGLRGAQGVRDRAPAARGRGAGAEDLMTHDRA